MKVKGPNKAGLFVTSRCNQRCVYCATESTRGLTKYDMTAQFVEDFLRMFPTIKRAGIGGGEPLCNPYISDIIDVCSERLINFNMSTNATRVRRLNIDWSKLGSVNVAGNDNNPYAYEKMTGTKLHSEMVKGTERLLSSGAKVTMSFVIDKTNINKMERYARFVKNLGVKRIAFQSICPRSDDYHGFQKIAILKKDASVMKLIHQQKVKVLNYGLKVMLWPKPIGNGVGQGCPMARKYIAVDGLGNVSICCRGPGPRPEMGNINQGPQVWSTGPMAALRSKVYDPKNKPAKCLMCKANWRRK
jgi:radical SAM protein with 4Fe4S-binding SPASM domain